MPCKLAEEVICKTDTEVRKVDFVWTNSDELIDGETISTVNGVPSATPSSLTVANPAVSATWVTVTLSAGTPQRSFTASSTTDTFTSSSHGYSDGHTIRLIADGLNTLPVLTDENAVAIDEADTTFYVVSSDANTYKLALTSGGTAVSVGTAGQGFSFIEYLVDISVITSQTQTLDLQGRVHVRD